jgi:uncharacterized membrane protein YgdD (TMEM256/DUF423 family)
MDRVWLGLGGLYGLTGVMMAALAAHALPGRVSATDLAFVHTAVQMQMWHALALIGCAVLARLWPGWTVTLAGIGFAAGTLLFCGAVYALALTGTDLPGMAPTGGFLTMLGWIALGSNAFRRRN